MRASLWLHALPARTVTAANSNPTRSQDLQLRGAAPRGSPTSGASSYN